MDLFLKISSFLRVVLLLLGFFVFQSSIIISAAANPVIFSQGHHTVISETYTYNEIESSAHVEIDLNNRLSRVFLKKRVRPEHEVLADVARVAAKTGVQYTKSSLKLGQEMHKAYKVGANGVKEFRLPSGKRIDFLDINNSTIFELKPFNPRAMKAGQNQLNMYLEEIQSPATLLKHPELRGINWKTVLDPY